MCSRSELALDRIAVPLHVLTRRFSATDGRYSCVYGRGLRADLALGMVVPLAYFHVAHAAT